MQRPRRRRPKPQGLLSNTSVGCPSLGHPNSSGRASFPARPHASNSAAWLRPYSFGTSFNFGGFVSLGVVSSGPTLPLPARRSFSWPRNAISRLAQAYRGYAKETMRRALAATRKRHAHPLAQRQMEEQSSTEFPNGGWNPFPNASKNLAENKAVSVKKFSALSLGWGARIRTWEWRNQTCCSTQALEQRCPMDQSFAPVGRLSELRLGASQHSGQ
jgi:hypothetical protein